MAKQRTGPLTDEHLKTLNKVIQACSETLAFCGDCEACDLDVEPERKKTEDQLRVAQKLKARFFPQER